MKERAQNWANLSIFAKLFPDNKTAAAAWRLLDKTLFTSPEVQNLPMWPTGHFQRIMALVPHKVLSTVVSKIHPGCLHIPPNCWTKRSREQMTLVPLMIPSSPGYWLSSYLLVNFWWGPYSGMCFGTDGLASFLSPVWVITDLVVLLTWLVDSSCLELFSGCCFCSFVDETGSNSWSKLASNSSTTASSSSSSSRSASLWQKKYCQRTD